MADTTVEELSKVLRIAPEKLLGQLEDAGIKNKKIDSIVHLSEKSALLQHLKEKRGQSKAKITINRTTSKIKKANEQKGVLIQVKKKRVTNKTQGIVDNKEVLKSHKKALEQAKIADAKQQEQDKKRLEVIRKQREEQEKNIIKTKEEKKAKEVEEKKPVIEVKEKVKTPKEKQINEEKFEKPDKLSKSSKEQLHIDTSISSRRRLKKKDKTRLAQQLIAEKAKAKHAFVKPVNPVIHEVVIPENIKVSDLALKMTIKAGEVLKAMMGMGVMATINDVIDQETAILVVEELGHKAVVSEVGTVEEELLTEIENTQAELEPRAPIVTIMGHVDHGKTSILDYIRKTKVTQGEHGGITQHIGAYQVNVNQQKITFIDTPGHAAFSKMRSRGANVTDIVILVVAQDDGVMPQTIESIKHAKAANVPIIVAINKMDKEGAQVEKIKQELANNEVIPDDWGGDVMMVGVSAHTGLGIDELLNDILLQAEILELKAPVKSQAKGVVLEAKLDKGRGKVATILVKEGTLEKGDVILAGLEYGRIRTLTNDLGKQIRTATPSTPVEVLGLSGIPNAGDEVIVLDNDKKAREIAEFRQTKDREAKLQKQQAQKLENFMSKMEQGDVSVLSILIKADVKGSAQALVDALEQLSTDEVKIKIIHSGVGGINESDVTLAIASNAIMVGFNVRADSVARKLIEREKIDVRYYSIIYQLIDDIKLAMSGLLSPELTEKFIGLAEVRDVFKAPKIGDIAGCMVTEGVVKRNNPIRVLRDNVVIFEGELESLRRFKESVNEVRAGTECGIGVKNYNNVQVGDQIEVFERAEIKRSI